MILINLAGHEKKAHIKICSKKKKKNLIISNLIIHSKKKDENLNPHKIKLKMK